METNFKIPFTLEFKLRFQRLFGRSVDDFDEVIKTFLESRLSKMFSMKALIKTWK